jgi:Transposase DDE domain
MNIQKYSVALVTSLGSSKNSSAVAREIGVDQSTASRFLQIVGFDETEFKPMIARLFGNKSLNFVVDDSVISRRYAKDTEGTSSMVDQSTKTFTNGCKIVVGGLTDGKFFLPICFEQWIAQFILGDAYRKTTDIAKSLISKLLDLTINVKCFVMDGLYFSEEFIQWLHNKNLKFVIKAKTTTSVLYKGEKIQLKNCKDLRLNSNQSAKTIVAEWAGKMWYFTAVRRSGKRGPKIIYLISNFKTKSKMYAKIYNSRWTIEKCFRTTKQSLGLTDSFSQYARTYLGHIKCVFFAFALMQLLMKKFRLNSTEDAIRKAQALKNMYGFHESVLQISLLENYA